MKSKFDLVKAMNDRIEELENLNKRLNKALEFYVSKWNHRKNYMRNYMTKARADGRVSKWRSKNEDQRI